MSLICGILSTARSIVACRIQRPRYSRGKPLELFEVCHCSLLQGSRTDEAWAAAVAEEEEGMSSNDASALGRRHRPRSKEVPHGVRKLYCKLRGVAIGNQTIRPIHLAQSIRSTGVHWETYVNASGYIAI